MVQRGETFLAQGNAAAARQFFRRAADLGLSTLVITVDVPVGSNRERNRRNGFGRPLRLSLRSKLDALRRPHWFRNYMQHGIARIANWEPYVGKTVDADGLAGFVASQIHGALTWSDVERFRKLWPRNLVLKGIMRPDDAIRAAELGVDDDPLGASVAVRRVDLGELLAARIEHRHDDIDPALIDGGHENLLRGELDAVAMRRAQVQQRIVRVGAHRERMEAREPMRVDAGWRSWFTGPAAPVTARRAGEGQ